MFVHARVVDAHLGVTLVLACELPVAEYGTVEVSNFTARQVISVDLVVVLARERFDDRCLVGCQFAADQFDNRFDLAGAGLIGAW